MNSLFPGKKRFTNMDEKGEIFAEWTSNKLDSKAKVVCEACNNGWMSEIDGQHAKPALLDLISGKLDIPVTQSRAASIALFCFKTASVFDLIGKNQKPFFAIADRYAFRKSLTIPSNVNMWMAGFVPIGKGNVHTGYFAGSTSPVNRIRMYLCTYAVGHFVFQLVAARTSQRLEPMPGFECVALPFWPRFESGVVWPLPFALKTVQDFDSFSMRWKTVSVSE
jgi:hypothetical protein